jgi:4-hydroxy-tetrahydrodipicolinate synthase
MEAATTLELAELPNIVAVKEASGDLPQIGEILRARPAGFAVLSGEDELTLAVMAAGGDGVISVCSNVTPRMVAALCECCAQSDLLGARELHERLMPWMSAAFVESNPIPAKAALAMLHRMGNHLRLPLVPLSAAGRAVVERALRDLHLLAA